MSSSYEDALDLSEFEFDAKASDRISKVVQMYPISLEDCADILESVAPLCTLWTPEGFLKRIQSMFEFEMKG